MDRGVVFTDQLPHGLVFRPSDLKRVPTYYAPASRDGYGDEVDSQTPVFLVPARAVRHPSSVAGRNACQDLSSNSANVSEELVTQGSAPEARRYVSFERIPMGIEVPVSDVVDSDLVYGNERGVVPMVDYEQLQRVKKARSPRFFVDPLRSGKTFCRPSNDEDPWIQRQIPSQFSRRHVGNLRASETGHRPGNAPHYVPLRSGRSNYGNPVPYEDFEGFDPVFHRAYDVDVQDFVDTKRSSWETPSQRIRSGVNAVPARAAREMHPAYTFEPDEDQGTLLPYRLGDDYYLVRGLDSFPIARDGCDGRQVGVDRDIYARPAGNQASIVPVDFPVSDLAKIRSLNGEGQEQPQRHPNVFYDPVSGRILLHDPRPALKNSSLSAPSHPSSESTCSPDSSNHWNDTYRVKDSNGPSSVNRSASSIRGLPTAGHPAQYLLPISHSASDSKESGEKEVRGLKAPKPSRLVPVPSSSAASNAVADDDRSSRVSDPFCLIKSLFGSDKMDEGRDDVRVSVDGQVPSSSMSNAAGRDDNSGRSIGGLNVQPLSGSNKVMEVFGDGSSAKGKSRFVTRVIPVSSPASDRLSKDSESRYSEVPSEVHNDHVTTNTGVLKEEKSKNPEEPKESSKSRQWILASNRNSKPSSDLMANIGKAIWTSKPIEKKSVLEDKSSTQRDGVQQMQKRGADSLSSVEKDVGSLPSQSSPERNLSLSQVREKTTCASDQKGASFTKSDGSTSVKPEAFDSVIHVVPASNANPTTELRKSSPQSFLFSQEQKCSNNSWEVENTEAVSVCADKVEANVSSAGTEATSFSRDPQVDVGKHPTVKESTSRELTESKEESDSDRHAEAPLSMVEAATRIQSRQRGYTVRRADIFKPLRTIKEAQAKLHTLQAQIRSKEDILSDPKERLKITETAMSLLLALDAIQGVHPFVREMRKYVSREVVSFLDRIEIALPDAGSSAIEAQPSDDADEVVADTDTEFVVEEEEMQDGFKDGESEVCEADQLCMAAAVHLVEDKLKTATATDPSTKEVLPEAASDREVMISKIDGTAISEQEDNSSELGPGNEIAAVSHVIEKPLENDAVSIGGEEPCDGSQHALSISAASAPSSEEIIEYLAETAEDVANTTASSLAIDGNAIKGEISSEAEESPVESLDTSTDATSSECRLGTVIAEEGRESSYLSTDGETMKMGESWTVGSTVHPTAGYDFINGEFANCSTVDSSLDDSDDKSVAVLSIDYPSSVDRGYCKIAEEAPVSLEDSDSGTSVPKDQDRDESSLSDVTEDERNDSSCQNQREMVAGAHDVASPSLTEETKCISSDSAEGTQIEVGDNESVSHRSSEPNVENLLRPDKGVQEIGRRLQTLETSSTDDDDILSCEQEETHCAISGECRMVSTIERVCDEVAENPERKETISSSGVETVKVEPNDLVLFPDENFASTKSSESSSDLKLESSGKLHEICSPLLVEKMQLNSKLTTTDENTETVDENGPGKGETITTLSVVNGGDLEDDVGVQTSNRSAASSCSTYDGYGTSLRESSVNSGEKSANFENRDTLLKHLTEENKKLQALFREVIQSNAEHKSTIKEMGERLGRLEQLVRKQDQRKEKRKKYKKTVRH